MKLKNIIISALFLAFSLSAFGQQFEGKWLIQAKDGSVEIYKKGGKYFGKVLTTKLPKDKNGKLRRDVKNPDPKKRNRTIQGLEVLSNFKLEGKELVGGKIYDSRTGKTYKGKIWIEGNTLMLRGYLGLFYATREWTRIR